MKWLRARCVPICVSSPCMALYTWLRNLDSKEAQAMMVDTLRWREEFKIEEVMKETYPDVFDGFGHLYGRDKEGRPIVYCPFVP